MKRKKLDIDIEEKPKRGAKKGDPPRNPEGKGGWSKGTSGNPQGRPPGSKNEIQISNVWDSWKQSHALNWLFYALNYKLPETLRPHDGELTKEEHVQFRQLLFRNYWAAMDWIRKTCGAKIAEEMSVSDVPMSIREMLAQGQAKRDGKLIDFEDKVRRKAK